MNWFDWLLIIGVIFSTYWSFRQGFILELFYFLAFVLGLIIAFLFYPSFQPLVEIVFEGPDLAATLSFITVFILAGAVLVLLGLLCHNFVHFIKLGFFDRLAGALLGLIRGVIIVGVILVMLVAISGEERPNYVENSTISRPVVRVVTWTMDGIPYLFDDFGQDYIARAEEWLEGFREE